MVLTGDFCYKIDFVSGDLLGAQRLLLSAGSVTNVNFAWNFSGLGKHDSTMLV